MEAPNQNKYLRKRKFLRTVFGVFSLSGILFAFQACYGTPKDFGTDVLIQGRVTSVSTKASLANIRVDIDQTGQYTVTRSDGTFRMWCEQMREYRLIFSDEQTPRNNRYTCRDTVIRHPFTNEPVIELTVDIELN